MVIAYVAEVKYGNLELWSKRVYDLEIRKKQYRSFRYYYTCIGFYITSGMSLISPSPPQKKKINLTLILRALIARGFTGSLSKCKNTHAVQR